MQYTVSNRATRRVVETTDVSGRVTTESIKHGLLTNKQTSLWRLAILVGGFNLLWAFKLDSPGLQATRAGTPAPQCGTAGLARQLTASRFGRRI